MTNTNHPKNPITNQDLFNALTDLALIAEANCDQTDQRLAKLELQIQSMAYEVNQTTNWLKDIDGRLLGVENDIKDLYLCLPVLPSRV